MYDGENVWKTLLSTLEIPSLLLLLLLSSPLCLLLFAVRVRFVGLGNNLKLFRLKLLVAVVAAALAPCAIPTAACCCSFCCFCWRFKVSNAVFSLALSILGQNLVWCLAKAFNFPRRNCLHYRPVLLLCSKVLLANTLTYTHTGAHTDTPAHTHTQPPTHAAQINCCCFRRLFVFEICFLNGNALLSVRPVLPLLLGPWTTTWAFNLLLPLPLPLFLLFCLPLAYLLFKFNLHYLKNLKSKNFSCANQRLRWEGGLGRGSSCFSCIDPGRSEVQTGPAAFEQLFCFNIFIYLRPGNFCLFLASFYDSGPSAEKCLL